MPPQIVITHSLLQYVALTALALVVATFLVTRIFYVRRIGKCMAQNLALQQRVEELNSRVQRADVRTPVEPVRTGRASQVVAVIAAIGGLSALVAATTPIIHDFLQGGYTQCKTNLSKSKELLSFDASQWQAAESIPVNTKNLSKKDIITLGQRLVQNSARDTIAITYDGTSPAIIDSERTVTIALTLEKPSTGVRLLVLPIRAPEQKK